MTVVCCGSRTWTDVDTIRAWLSKLPRGTRVAHGCARGADEIADRIARKLELAVARYPADWSLGKRAGPERNSRMLEAEKPRRVFAFSQWSDEREGLTRGTADCVAKALRMGIAVVVIPSGSRP